MTTSSRYLPAILAAGLFLGGGALAHGARTDARHTQDARATTALNLLEEHGYAKFQDFHVDGAKFAATAAKAGGKNVKVEIDPDTDQVSVIPS